MAIQLLQATRNANDRRGDGGTGISAVMMAHASPHPFALKEQRDLPPLLTPGLPAI
jgi:hypothetical protein